MTAVHHTCAVCARVVPVHLLMCYSHWRSVPTDLQVQVHRTWALYTRGGLRGTPKARRSYMQARQAAIDAVKPTAPITPPGAPHES
jgi:hypothetical protein